MIPDENSGRDTDTDQDDRERQQSEAAQREGAERSDAAGYDVEAPPAAYPHGTGNPGLHDEPAVERDGWREIDTDREFGDEWLADTPYPGPANQGETEQLEQEVEAPANIAAGTDLLETVTAALEDDLTLEVFDLSVETRGSTVILRGSAETLEARQRAVAIASAVPGVEHVEDLLSAS